MFNRTSRLDHKGPAILREALVRPPDLESGFDEVYRILNLSPENLGGSFRLSDLEAGVEQIARDVQRKHNALARKQGNAPWASECRAKLVEETTILHSALRLILDTFGGTLSESCRTQIQYLLQTDPDSRNARSKIR